MRGRRGFPTIVESFSKTPYMLTMTAERKGVQVVVQEK
jgi:hypothetical protein